MFSIPLSFIIFLYALFVLLTLIFATINIYHLVSTGMLNLLSFSVSALVVLFMVAVIAITGIYLGTLDTAQAFVLFDTTPTQLGF